MASQQPWPHAHARVRRLPVAGTNRDALRPTVVECLLLESVPVTSVTCSKAEAYDYCTSDSQCIILMLIQITISSKEQKLTPVSTCK